MKNCVKSELWKALHNGFFYSAIGIGLLIVLVDVTENIQTVSALTERTIEGYLAGRTSGGHDGFSLFLLALPYNGINFASRLYLYVWPILAAMPYGWSYCRERRDGVYNQIVSRGKPSIYFFSKFTAVFVSGGVAVALPAFLDILVNALVCPYAVMNVADSIASIFNGWFLSGLYYTHPWAHAMIWCGVLFLLGGSTAVLCLLAGAKLQLQVLVALLPFAILTLWNLVYQNLFRSWLPRSLSEILLSPASMVMAATSNPNPEWAVFLVIGVMSALGLCAGYWQVTKHELV